MKDYSYNLWTLTELRKDDPIAYLDVIVDTGLIFQDKFLLILLPFLSVAFKRHFVNNHDKHSLVFDNQCSNEIFDYYIYPCSY